MTTKEAWIKRKERYGKSGCKNPEERKLKISINTKLALAKPEVKERITIARRKRKEKYGYINSPETRRRLSLALKGRKCPWNQKTIRVANKGSFKKGHEVLESWREAVKKNRINQIFPMKDSSIEVKLQKFLTEVHIEFYTHKYISEINHSYQCDIFIPKQIGIKQKTIIEADGCYWHGCNKCNKKIMDWTKKRRILDNQRTKELIEKGFKVLRLWEHDIKTIELNDFKEIIRRIK